MARSKGSLGGGTAKSANNPRDVDDETVASNEVLGDDLMGDDPSFSSSEHSDPSVSSSEHSDEDGGHTKRFPVNFEEWTALEESSGVSFAEAYVASVQSTQPRRNPPDFRPFSLAEVSRPYWNRGYFVLPRNKTIWEWQVLFLMKELARASKKRLPNPYDSKRLNLNS